MNSNYIARVEIDRPASTVTDELVDQLMDALVNYQPAIGASQRGHLEVRITVPADGMRQASTTALAVLEDAVLAALGPNPDMVASEILTEHEANARDGFVSLPSLIGTAEAATIIGVSQQRVAQLVNAGQLSATKAGRALALARHEVEAFAARERQGGRPRKAQS